MCAKENKYTNTMEILEVTLHNLVCISVVAHNHQLIVIITN